MGSFITYKTAKRAPAVPGKPVVDPAGWQPEDMRDIEGRSYRFSETDIAELLDGVAAVRRAGIEFGDIAREHFPLRKLTALFDDARHELLEGRGVVLMRGFPVDRMSREDVAIAYLGLGAYLGTRVPQNQYGHVLGHVIDLGRKKTPDQRGYMTSDEMSFHTDSTDFVALLCLHGAKSGGESRMASLVTVYNRILKERPDLASVLTGDFYKTRYGEVDPGQLPYEKWPIVSFIDGYFSATGYSSSYDKAQGLPGVPPFTPQQLELKTLFRRIVQECAVEMTFQPGDVQVLNNYVITHSRYEYEDWPEPERKRHLLRQELNDPVGRPIPEARRMRRNSGVRLEGMKLIAPIEVEFA